MRREKSKKGLPSIASDNGRLKIRLTYQGKRYSLAVGLPDTATGKKLANSICEAIEKDISLGIFDVSMKRYRDLTPNASRQCEEVPLVLTISTLWERYVQFKTPQVEETTVEIKYGHISGWLTKIPYDSLDDAIAIRDWLIEETTIANTKAILQQLSSCCKWAYKSGMVKGNPFQGLSADLYSKKGKKEIEYFSREEMKLIVERFYEREDHYAPFVEFLFLTGCRSSEAVGLQWKHINQDLTKIRFQRAIVRSVNGYKFKSLKTQDSREFPINHKLKELLERIKPENCDPESCVFVGTKSRSTRHIDLPAFHASHWVKLVNELVEEGKLERYLTQYATRHTFITLALQAGVDVATVAKWVGNSPKTIWEHYSGANKDLIVPEF